MTQTNRICLVIVLIAGLFLSSVSLTEGSDTARQLQSAVRRMNDWLGNGQKAEGWRRALLLHALDTQTAKAEHADVHRLREILSRFESNTPGLDHPCFVDVRNALRNHWQLLTQSQSVDIPSRLAEGATPFRPIAADEVHQLRDRTIQALQLMKLHYQANYHQLSNEKLFAKLEYDAMIDTLKAFDVTPFLATQGNDDAATRTARNEAFGKINRLVQSLSSVAMDQSDEYFVASQKALDKFFRAAFYASDRNAATELNTQLAAIRNALPRIGGPEDRQARIELGNALGWLEYALQSPELVMAIRTRYSLPNAHLHVSRNFLQQLASTARCEQRPVAEYILGRYIQGSALTNSQVSVDLVDDPNQISASLHLNGQIHSDTFTSQGPITAFTGSNGVFEGRRSLLGNVNGFYEKEPYVAANLQSYFKGVNVRWRIVDRIANKQYQKDKEVSEGIAAARAERRIHDEFSQQSTTQITKAKGELGTLIEKTYNYSRWIPPVGLFSRTDSIRGIVNKTDMFRLGATTSPVATSSSHDVQFQLHESLLTNFADPLLAGKTFTNRELAEQVERITNKIPEFLVEQEGEEPWSIRFPPTQAIRVEIENQQLAIYITGRSFTRGDNNIRGGLIIRVTMAVLNENGRWYVDRVGDVSIDYEDPSEVTAPLSAFKNFLEKKVNTPPESDVPTPEERLELPPNLIPLEQIVDVKNKELASKLVLTQFSGENGWLHLGWNYRAHSHQSMVVNLPAVHHGKIVPQDPVLRGADSAPTPDGQ